MRKIQILIGLGIGLALLLGGCAGPAAEPAPTATLTVGEGGMVFAISSSAFEAGKTIPRQYTCDGENISPPLTWTEPPAGVQSFALIVDDPDAPVGTWVHWVLYNLPAETRELPEGVVSDARLPDGGLNGQNSGRRSGYSGPCPPGGTHRYFFKLYALDTVLTLEPGARADALQQAMQGHILGQAELMGIYKR